MSERAGAVVAVDVGGSGLRLTTYAGSPGPVLTAPGVRVGSGGIDVAALVADARSLSASAAAESASGAVPPEVVVWSMRGLLFLVVAQLALRKQEN